MKCPKCSEEIAEGLKFCTSCGERLEAAAGDAGKAESGGELKTDKADKTSDQVGKKQRRRIFGRNNGKTETEQKEGSAGKKRRRLPIGWAVSIVLLIALLSVIFIPKIFPRSEVIVSRSPEAAIRKTLGFIGDGDAEGALRTMWGFNAEATSKASFTEYIDRFGYFSASAILPESIEPYSELNAEAFRGEAVDYLKRFYLSTTPAVREGRLDLSRPVAVGAGVYGSSGELLSDIMPSDIESLVIEEIKLAKPEMQRSESVQAAFAQRNAVMGFSESREYAVLLTLGGESYVCGVTVVRSGGGWQVYAFTSSLTGTSSYGCIAPVTDKQYSELTK